MLTCKGMVHRKTHRANTTPPFLSSDNKALSSVLEGLAFPRLVIGSLPPLKALPYTDASSHGLISCPDPSSGAMLRMLRVRTAAVLC